MTKTSFSVLSLGMAIVCSGCAVWNADTSEEATEFATIQTPVGNELTRVVSGVPADTDAPSAVSFTPTEITSVGAEVGLCGVTPAQERTLEDLEERLEDSVHEMVKCGQLQTGVAGNLMTLLLVSNEDLFSSGFEYDLVVIAAQAMGLMTSVPFEHDGEGGWRMDIKARPGSSFELRFYRQDEEAPIVDDPFDVGSYLLGARVKSDNSLLEMISYPNRKTTFTFHFDSEGPLADLLNYGEPIPNPFEVKVSMNDLAALGNGEAPSAGADFGPLQSLVEADMTSVIRLRDDQGSVTVSYDAAGRRNMVASIAADGVGFELEGLKITTNAELSLVANPASLRFVPGVGLAGEVTLQVEGISQSLVLHSDYGEGTDRPDTSWRCP